MYVHYVVFSKLDMKARLKNLFLDERTTEIKSRDQISTFFFRDIV